MGNNIFLPEFNLLPFHSLIYLEGTLNNQLLYIIFFCTSLRKEQYFFFSFVISELRSSKCNNKIIMTTAHFVMRSTALRLLGIGTK